MKNINHKYICPIYVSDNGRYVIFVKEISYSEIDIIPNSIIIEEVDMEEQQICFEENIYVTNPIVWNYIKKFSNYYDDSLRTSSGWTIKVPSSPDNSTKALIYLIPNLYIGGCDFRGSTFDDETKEIIRQYNGIV